MTIFAHFSSFQTITPAKTIQHKATPHKPLAGGLKFFPDSNRIHKVVLLQPETFTEICWSNEVTCCLSESVWQICGSACVCPTSATCQSCNYCLKCQFLMYFYYILMFYLYFYSDFFNVLNLCHSKTDHIE